MRSTANLNNSKSTRFFVIKGYLLKCSITTNKSLIDFTLNWNTLKEHKEQVYKVLKALSDAGQHLKPEKCHFHKQEVKYLGFIITTNGIQMDPEKVSCILGWEVPRTVTDVQCFFGFANFYRRFIRDYSKVVMPLTRMTK